MISDPGSTRGSSSRRVKASILPSPICSRVANRLEGEHCEMWDAPPAPPDPPTGSTTHQRDPRPHLQKSRTHNDHATAGAGAWRGRYHQEQAERVLRYAADKPAWGYPFNRTMLGRWNTLA